MSVISWEEVSKPCQVFGSEGIGRSKIDNDPQIVVRKWGAKVNSTTVFHSSRFLALGKDSLLDAEINRID